MNEHNNPSDNPPPNKTELVTASANAPALHQPSYGQVGDYMGGGFEAQEDFSFNLYEYWRIISKRKWLILGFIGIFVALGATYTLMQTPLYTSKVRIQIDRKSAQIVERGNVLQGEGSSDKIFLHTQLELIKGRMMASRVVSTLHLESDKGFLKQKSGSVLGALKKLAGLGGKKPGGEKVNGIEQRKRSAVSKVLRQRQVTSVLGSRLFDIKFIDPNPKRAQKIATAYGDAFIAANIDKRFQANSSAKVFLEDKIGQLKIRLRASEKSLLDFARKKQIVAISNKSSIAENNLSQANVKLGDLVSERIKKEQLWKQVQSESAINLPQLRSSKIFEGLRTKRNGLSTSYQEKLQTFKPSYPAMVEIKNKMRKIDQQIKKELSGVRQSLEADYQAALSQENEMKARISRLKTQALDLKQQSIQYNILKREVDTNRSLYNGLLQRFKEVDIAAGVGANNVFVVDIATLPEFPSSPKLMRALLLFFALGLGGGIGTAFLLEHLDDTVHTAEELHALSGLTTLGIIPRLAENSNIEQEFVDPRSPISEAYRSMATSLQLSTATGLPKTVVLTSAGPGEGKSTTAIALARHFATMGMKVLLVDGDLRKASLHEKLGLPNSVGLSNYLTGACEPPEAIQATQTPNLAFMCSGPLPPNAADLLGGNKLFSLLSVGLEIFDFIVIDGPPMLGLADAQLLANAASATIFVTASGQTSVGQVRGALNRLRIINSPVIGTVLTKFDAKSSGYGGYGTYGGDEHFSYGNQTEVLEKGGAAKPAEKPEQAQAAAVKKDA